MRILIAEDDAPTRKLYAHTLRQHGSEVDFVQNGQEAVDLIIRQEHLYRLCIMDIEMPVMGRLEAIRRLRQNNISLQIIAVSSSQEYRQRSIDAGANEYCCKSISEDIIVFFNTKY